ncbi:MAG: hypothetical protein ACYTET_06040 [Planctomycetota bacterium]|jgi:hypothetical protein
MKRSMMMVQILVVVCVSAMLVGCQQASSSNATTAAEPVKISGGGDISADCVVHYFRVDQSPYITEQQHTFKPEAGSLKIVSREPYGVFGYHLNKNQFSSTKKVKQGLSDLDVDFCDRKLATTLFYSFTAGANLLDKSLFATSDHIKIEGQWYQPYQPGWPSDELQVSLFQGLGSERIELVRIDNSETGQSWLARSYNLRYSKQLDRLVPRKIDVYDISDGVASKKLVIQVDYKQIQVALKTGISEENNG